MQKQTPTTAQVAAMAVFALSCFGLLLYLWLAFGGSVPLRPQGYQVRVSFAEAATLAAEADVRLAGVNVGKVKHKQLDGHRARTLVTLELEPEFAPIPRDTRAILRQKTLLGETYVELTPGSRNAARVPDGGRLPTGNVEPTVELDEIFQAFDRDTRQAFQAWVRESAAAAGGSAPQDLNDALGNLDEFAADGAGVLEVLDDQRTALRAVVRNTGTVFRALTRRDGELRSLIEEAGQTFDAIASRDRALAETFRVFPTFLDESRSTLARLQDFSQETRPLVNDLRPVADRLGPTVRDLGRLAPDLRQLFRDLDPVIDASAEHSPELVKVLGGAAPVLERLSPFLSELNPIVSYANYNQFALANFISHAAFAFGATLPPVQPDGPRRHYLRAYGAINARSLSFEQQRPPHDRGNAYPLPNGYARGEAIGTVAEAFTCPHGEVPEPHDNGLESLPPCLIAPPSLYDGNQFPNVRRGEAELVRPPSGAEGTQPPKR